MSVRSGARLRRIARLGGLAIVTAAGVTDVSPALTRAAPQPHACTVLSPCEEPTVSAPQVQLTGPQTATVTATIDPNNAATSYTFTDTPTGEDDQSGNTATGSDPGTLPATSTAQTVTWNLTGLTPGTDFAVSINARNGYGSGGSIAATGITAGPTNFSTPLMPATNYTVSVTPAVLLGPGNPGNYSPPSDIDVGGNIRVRAHTSPSMNATTGVLLQAAYPPSRVFETIAGGNVTSSGAISWQETLINVLGRGPISLTEGPDSSEFGRNVLLRVESQGHDQYPFSAPQPFGVDYQTRHVSYSAPVELKVIPEAELDITLQTKSTQPVTTNSPPPPRTGRVDIGLSILSSPPVGTVATSGGPKPSRHLPAIYLYHRNGAGAPFLRLAKLPEGPLNATNAHFAATIDDPSLRLRGDFMVCTAAPFSPYLGPAFRFSPCGAATLNTRAPHGAEYLFVRKYVLPSGDGLQAPGTVPGVT